MKNLLPVDIDFSKLEARLWAGETLGVESGKEDRRAGGCVKCLRRKVFRTAAAGKGEGASGQGGRTPLGRSTCAPSFTEQRGPERHMLRLLPSQNCAGSAGWETKWAKELRTLEKQSLERWTVKPLEEGKKVKPDRTCKFWGEVGRGLRDGVLDETEE